MDKWKIIAIIFMVLFIIENMGIYLLYQEGQKETDNKLKCSNEICYNKNSLSFIYENNVCYCYNENKEPFYQEILK